MDAAIVVSHDADDSAARVVVECRKLRDIKVGDSIVCGLAGLRVLPQFRDRERADFAFMSNEVSSERRVESSVARIAAIVRDVKRRGERVVFVAGPVVIHTGGAPYFIDLIRRGYVDAVLAGNALAVHDAEQVLFGTSLGVDLEAGVAVQGGHRHHMRAINTINRAGGIRGAMDSGALPGGVMVECVRAGVEYVLAGSIRDDGPLVDTITDIVEAQNRYSRRPRVGRDGDRAVDDAAWNRRGEHAPRLGAGRVRRHQSRGRDQARRPRFVADDRPRYRRRALSASAGKGAGLAASYQLPAASFQIVVSVASAVICELLAGSWQLAAGSWQLRAYPSPSADSIQSPRDSHAPPACVGDGIRARG